MNKPSALTLDVSESQFMSATAEFNEENHPLCSLIGSVLSVIRFFEPALINVRLRAAGHEIVPI